MTTINGKTKRLPEEAGEAHRQLGADVVFEASGALGLWRHFRSRRPWRLPGADRHADRPSGFDVVAACVKEARIETVFRCANIQTRAIERIRPRRIDLSR